MDTVTAAVPRVNYETMQTYIGSGKRVLLAGRIETMDAGKLTLKSSDNVTVTVMVKPNGSGNYETQCVEVTGTVVDQTTFQEEDHHCVADNFDLNMYNEMIKMSSGRYSALFQ